MTRTARSRLGAIGERIAARHLEAAGMTVLARNWRARGEVRGELDLVVRDGDVLVVCEVKTRRRSEAGAPLEAITPRKLAQLRRLAAAFLADTGARAAGIRIDAVGVAWPVEGGRAQVVHVPGIG
jgi:putative endonuclease